MLGAMKAAHVYASPDGAVFLDDPSISLDLDLGSLRKMRVHEVEKSSVRNLLIHLQRAGALSSWEDWKFWRGPSRTVDSPDVIPGVRLFHAEGALRSEDLVAYVRKVGAPDILFVNGHDFAPHLELILSLCPQSTKVVYSRNWKPWTIEEIERYDICLVDDAKHRARVQREFPAVHAAVWVKIIDYDVAHHPIACAKKYDICYVAFVRPRKNHRLLFEAMAKLKERNLSCVCVGSDVEDTRAGLEQLADELGISVTFVGQVPKSDVNRYVNESRIGVMCSERDTAPRALLEYLATDIPVVVNARLRAGLQYVGSEAGVVSEPESFHEGIAHVLDNLDSYTPREYLLKHFSARRAVQRFVEIMQEAGHPIPTRPV